MNTQYYVFLSLLLFAIGVMGVLTRRNAIVVFMCIELMLSAVNLLLVSFGKVRGIFERVFDAHSRAGADAQVFVLFVMVVAAAEVVVGLSVVVMVFRNTHSVDVDKLDRLKY